MVHKFAHQWGQNIRRRRTELGKTLQQVANAVGVSRQAIWQIENGHVVPRDETKIALAAALDTTLNDLFAWPEDDNR